MQRQSFYPNLEISRLLLSVYYQISQQSLKSNPVLSQKKNRVEGVLNRLSLFYLWLLNYRRLLYQPLLYPKPAARFYLVQKIRVPKIRGATFLPPLSLPWNKVIPALSAKAGFAPFFRSGRIISFLTASFLFTSMLLMLLNKRSEIKYKRDFPSLFIELISSSLILSFFKASLRSSSDCTHTAFPPFTFIALIAVSKSSINFLCSASFAMTFGTGYL